MAKYNSVFEFDPIKETGIDVPRVNREQALKDIAEFVRDSALEMIADQRSPVTGRKFAKLSTEYRKFKSSQGATPVPNLEFQGDLLAALEAKVSRGKIKYGVFDSSQSGKAEGNNEGTYGKNTGPARRFIPLKGEFFTDDIFRGIEEILISYQDIEKTNGDN